ncbi:MAG TPA: SGNH/GDSL hydrolase family protein [Hyphomicrobiaceae bacterium]|jgi:lysophospholipase L1-like esterase
MHRLQILAAVLAAALALAPARVAAEMAPTPPSVSKECGDSGVTDRPLPNSAAALQQRKRVKILAIGASSTAVLGLGRDGSPLLERILERTIKGLDVEIINRGFSGELAEAAGERIRIEVALNQPDIVLWQVGTNDALAQVPVDTFEQSVTGTVQWLKAHNVDVILVGLHYAKRLAKDAHYQAIRTSLRRVAIAENVLRIGRYEAMEVLARTMASSDRPVLEDFGLTEAGYNCMAEYLARTITVGLFAKPPKAGAPGAQGSDPAAAGPKQ